MMEELVFEKKKNFAVFVFRTFAFEMLIKATINRV